MSWAGCRRLFVGHDLLFIDTFLRCSYLECRPSVSSYDQNADNFLPYLYRVPDVTDAFILLLLRFLYKFLGV